MHTSDDLVLQLHAPNLNQKMLVEIRARVAMPSIARVLWSWIMSALFWYVQLES